MKEEILLILEEIQPDFNFNDDVHFVEEGYLDSLDMVQLIVELENKFDVRISALDIIPENFCSLHAIQQLIAKSK